MWRGDGAGEGEGLAGTYGASPGYGFAPHGYDGSPTPLRKISLKVLVMPLPAMPPSYLQTWWVTIPGGTAHVAGHGWFE